LERRLIALPWLKGAHYSGLDCVVQHSKSDWLMTDQGQNRLSEECPRRVRFTSTNRHQSPQLSRPVSADIVAEVCSYSSEAAASISPNGSHHPLFAER
jgi:hypothetical protein